MLVNNLTTEVSPAKVYALLSSRSIRGSGGEGEELAEFSSLKHFDILGE